MVLVGCASVSGQGFNAGICVWPAFGARVVGMKTYIQVRSRWKGYILDIRKPPCRVIPEILKWEEM